MKPHIVQQLREMTNPQERNYHYWLLSDQEDLICVRSMCREFVFDVWRDAHIIYQRFAKGHSKISHAAVGVGPLYYDNDNQFDRKQAAIQLITPWMYLDSQISLLFETKLWANAMHSARLHYRKLGIHEPLWDARTEVMHRDEELIIQ